MATRLSIRFLREIALGFFAAVLIAHSQADAADVIEIEEHWQLNVSRPSASPGSPHGTTVMSVTGDEEGDRFVVTLNHWTLPTPVSGGLQTQHWNEDACRDVSSCLVVKELSHAREKITWVQTLRVFPTGDLTFRVSHGTGRSWGRFANGSRLRLNTEIRPASLNDYQPAMSVANAGLEQPGDGQSTLQLVKVRWKTDDGKRHERQGPFKAGATLLD